MADVHQLPDLDTVEREASEWIARLHAENAPADDLARFESWRSGHPRRARAYDELLATWRELESSGPTVRAVAFGQAMNEATKTSRSRTRTAYAWAASLAAAAIIGAWHFMELRTDTLFQTAVGEHVAVTLPDGSVLELNSDSRARVNYSQSARIVRLERGEAFFNVVHEPGRAFWVVTRDSWVRAVGTAFNVYLRPSGIQVTVSEGTVKVAGELSAAAVPSDEAMSEVPVATLTAGQRIEVREGAAEIRSLPPLELTRSVAWRRGTLYFENQSLGTVLEEIGRYTALKIIVNDEKLRRTPIGGTFQASPQGAEQLLSMLEDGFGLKISRHGDERVLVEGMTEH